MSASRVPRYSRQREKGRADRAYVCIAGRKVKLGTYGSDDSKAKYAAVIADCERKVGQAKNSFGYNVTETPTVNEVLVAYLEYAQVYYRQPDGEVSKEYGHVRRTAIMVREAVGTQRAGNIGPKRIKLIREEMVAKGWTRKFINDQTKRIVRMFRWAASEEMIDGGIPVAMQAIEGLRSGRSNAKESKIVRPVADAVIAATLEHLPAVVADMVRFQRLTGCRPGEMISMRPCDLDRSGAVWLYRPATHKTAHRGHDRTIAVGPKSQAVLLRYLARDSQACCFRPCDSEAKRRAERSAARKTPLSYGNSTHQSRC